MAAQGLTMEQIARSLGIAAGTLYAKKNDVPELDEAIKTGRAKGVATISNSLFQSAKSGNVTAQIFYLKNRAPDEWKDRKETSVEHSGDVNLVNILTGLAASTVDNPAVESTTDTVRH